MLLVVLLVCMVQDMVIWLVVAMILISLLVLPLWGGGALGFASPVNGVRSGLTSLGVSFASTYVPTKFKGKYW